jgi:hypothetical protein
MKAVLIAGTLAATLMASSASAQGFNLSGRWQCTEMCLGPQGSFAFITQHGWQLNTLNEAGQPSPGWIDYPGHLWLQSGQGAFVSPDGDTIQFDHGTIWARAPEVVLPPSPPPLPPPPPPPRHKHKHKY